MNGFMFFNQQESGERLADMIETMGLDLDGFKVVAVNQDGILVSHPIAKRFDLQVVPMVVAEFSAGQNGHYLTTTSFGDGLLHNGLDCCDGGAGSCLGVMNLQTMLPALCEEVMSQLFEQTMNLNLGRPVFAPARALLVIDEVGDGYKLLAAIDALRRNGTKEIIVVTPVAERWFCDVLDVGCIALASVFNWAGMPEDFTGWYASMPILPDQLAAFTVREFGASWAN